MAEVQQNGKLCEIDEIKKKSGKFQFDEKNWDNIFGWKSRENAYWEKSLV